jgi:leucyl aminopeptidase (aminopeptidase T)
MIIKNRRVHMNEEFVKIAKNILMKNVELRPNEKVCIISDDKTKSIGEAFWSAAVEMGTDPVLCMMRTRKMHGHEPPDAIAAAAKVCDVILLPTTYAITHTRARREASMAGARVLIMRSITEDSFVNGAINADYDEISVVTQKAADTLARSRSIRMVSDKGTDFRCKLDDRPALCSAGLNIYRRRAVVLPTGEAAKSPLEGTSEGILVIDYLIDGIGLLKEPITLVVKEGRVVEVKGGAQAQELRDIFASDPNANNIAEFAIGTNPKSRMLGNPAEDKVRRGSVHIWLGDNEKTLSGTVSSQVHIDATIYRPTVWLDDNMVISEGVLKIV